MSVISLVIVGHSAHSFHASVCSRRDAYQHGLKRKLSDPLVAPTRNADAENPDADWITLTKVEDEPISNVPAIVALAIALSTKVAIQYWTITKAKLI